MPRFLRATRIRRLEEAGLEEVWRTLDIDPHTHASRDNRALSLHDAVSALLAGWPLEEIEEQAWVFALDGWQHSPPLIADYDEAFHKHYLRVLSEARLRSEGTETLAILFEEFRNRVQFIQVRAADIRLSHQLGSLVTVSIERTAPVLDRLNEMLKAADPAQRLAVLTAFEDSGQAALLHAVAKRIGQYSPEVGAAVESTVAPLLKGALELLSQVPGGVAGNLAHGALMKMLMAVAPDLAAPFMP